MRSFLMSISCAAAAATSATASPQDLRGNPAQEVEHLITVPGFAGPLRILSHDLFEGRGVASRGDHLSRLYIATQFEMFGLEPGGDSDNRWEQRVPLVGITSEVTRPLSVKGAKGEASFSAPVDYTATAGGPGENQAFEHAEIVFVGYGIHAPEQNWDDFKGADLQDKVLLFMNNDPSSDPALFAGRTRLYYGRWSYKFEEAARRGAAGAIVIHTTPSAGYPFQVIQATHGRENFWLPFAKEEPHLKIRSWCSEEAARKMAALGGHDLDSLRARAETRDFRPVPLGVTADLAIHNSTRQLESANVLGILPGSDPKIRDEIVVVTAHFDHLGIGRPKKGDAIYNGGLDNATGSAALISLARACAALESRPRRTILFAAVTAEESGLLGSKWYAKNPTFPRRKLVANFNIDGVNIWGRTTDIAMIGHGKNSLTTLADQVARRRGRVLVANPNVDLGLFYRSDHFSFARAGIPSAFFKAGSRFTEKNTGRTRIKRMYTTVHYHQPSDEFDDRWVLDGAVADMHFILECLVRTANSDAAPTWTPGDEFEKNR